MNTPFGIDTVIIMLIFYRVKKEFNIQEWLTIPIFHSADT